MWVLAAPAFLDSRIDLPRGLFVQYGCCYGRFIFCDAMLVWLENIDDEGAVSVGASCSCSTIFSARDGGLRFPCLHAYSLVVDILGR